MVGHLFEFVLVCYCMQIDQEGITGKGAAKNLDIFLACSESAQWSYEWQCRWARSRGCSATKEMESGVCEAWKISGKQEDRSFEGTGPMRASRTLEAKKRRQGEECCKERKAWKGLKGGSLRVEGGHNNSRYLTLNLPYKHSLQNLH